MTTDTLTATERGLPADRSPAPDVHAAAPPRSPWDERIQATARPFDGIYTWRLRFGVLLMLAVTGGALFLLQRAVWGDATTPTGPWSYLRWLSLLWVAPLPLGLVSVLGMFLQRRPARYVPSIAPPRVCFRYVSRGTNVDSLTSAIESVRSTMQRCPIFPYEVEVVVERPVGLSAVPGVREIVVPPEYRTRNGTLFKARGLQYALEVSPVADGTWLFHCDEESHITESLVLGIAQAVAEEELTGRHRIGQGCVLYHHTLRDNPILTLADSIRTGDDVGRWHLQNGIAGLPLLGMHGSFILVRNSVEKSIGFDYGPSSSVTEDAWWALLAAERGHRTRWVEGFLVEQAPERVRDFIKQRRRWMSGLARVARHAPVRSRYRVPLMLCMVAWALGPLSLVWTCTDLAFGVPAPLTLQIIGDLTFGCFAVIYLVGLRMNLHAAPQGRRTPLLYVAQVLLMPFFSLLEVTGTAYALVNPRIDFHVIQKSH